MQISNMHWQQVESYLKHDDRAVLPLGSTEQHAYLSLSTDSILAERLAHEAAEPLGVVVFPVVHYGITPYFQAFPGTISLRVATYINLVQDILEGMYAHGFRRIVVVNGHGGNGPALAAADEWLGKHPDGQIKWHNWWNAPQELAKVKEIDPLASHASWMENFPWTRLANVIQPAQQKPMVEFNGLHLGPNAMREILGDGNFGGYYQRSDSDSQALWDVAIAETRALIKGPWRS
jgi:creatinine amidohydrolase